MRSRSSSISSMSSSSLRGSYTFSSCKGGGGEDGCQISRHSLALSPVRAEGECGALRKQMFILSLSRQATPLKPMVLRGLRKDGQGVADAGGLAWKTAQVHWHPRPLCSTPPFSSRAQGKPPTVNSHTCISHVISDWTGKKSRPLHVRLSRREESMRVWEEEDGSVCIQVLP